MDCPMLFHFSKTKAKAGNIGGPKYCTIYILQMVAINTYLSSSFIKFDFFFLLVASVFQIRFEGFQNRFQVFAYFSTVEA